MASAAVMSVKLLDNLDHGITRPESPKVVRERKSRDIYFDPNYSSPKPQLRKKQASEVNLQKLIFDMNNLNCNWESRYDVENSEFAKGAYGRIMLARNKISKEKVVIKKIPLTTPARMIEAEVKAGKAIGTHPNIAALLHYYERQDFHYIFFQHFESMDLFCYLEKLNFEPRSEDEARKIFTQIISALQHIHSKNIAHRDIKLENILIDANGRVALIDLGLCAFAEEGKLLKDWCGSDNYLAPEIVRRNPYNGYKADVFSAGVVLFSMVFGVFPFENLRVNGNSTLRPLRTLSVRFPSDVKASLQVKDLLVKMLEDSPEKRLSLSEIFAHEWLRPSSATSDSDSSPVFSLKNSCEAGPVP